MSDVNAFLQGVPLRSFSLVFLILAVATGLAYFYASGNHRHRGDGRQTNLLQHELSQLNENDPVADARIHFINHDCRFLCLNNQEGRLEIPGLPESLWPTELDDERLWSLPGYVYPIESPYHEELVVRGHQYSTAFNRELDRLLQLAGRSPAGADGELIDAMGQR